MAELIVVKGEDGKLAGLGDKGERAWARFQKMLTRLQVGESLRWQYWEPRSPGFHARHFKIIDALFKQQDQFVDSDAFRKWLEVGAGFCDICPGPRGKPVAMPRSIAWDKLDEKDFEEHHDAVMTFARSTHATRFLWPWMTDLQADDLVNNVLSEFGA